MITQNRLDRRVTLTVFYCCLCSQILAQNFDYQVDSVKRYRKRRIVVGSAAISGYSASMLVLNQIWYSKYERTSFRFFDDSKEWLQYDKIGHSFSGFWLSYGLTEGYKYLGMKPKRAAWVGMASGFLAMLPIEIMDGYSAGYGASKQDLYFNAIGSSFSGLQMLLWDEVRIIPKVSFWPSRYPNYRYNNAQPELGDNLMEQFIKDYNGQTIWLSFDVYSFTKTKHNWLKYTNLSVGYGIDGMIRPFEDYNRSVGLDPTRQFYFAVDLDLSHIKTKSRFLNFMLKASRFVRFPAPAIEWNLGRGIVFKPIFL